MKAPASISCVALAALSLAVAAPAVAQEAAPPSQPPAEEDSGPEEEADEPLIVGGELGPAREARTAPEPRGAPPVEPRRDVPQVSAPPLPAPSSGSLPPSLPVTDAPLPTTLSPSDPIPAADAPRPVAADTAVLAGADERRPSGETGPAAWLWLLAGVLLTLVALALWRLIAGGRGRGQIVVEQHHSTPAAMGAAAGAAAAAQARPWVELSLRPFRAGVEGQAAIVEFELAVDNQGAAPARDVRVSTWMFPGGAAQQGELERRLIEEPPASTLPGVSLDPGEMRRIATAVSLPTTQVEAGASLPIVVADARYTLPDGSEGRTAASFAVGMRDGEQFVHFAAGRPSGLHNAVEARLLGEPDRR